MEDDNEVGEEEEEEEEEDDEEEEGSKTDQVEKEGEDEIKHEESMEENMEADEDEVAADDEVIDSNQESEADTANSTANSPFKRPSDAQSVDGSSKGGRERHLSMTSMESESENSTNLRQSVTEDLSRQYAQQLAFYQKPIVGQDTVCMFCLTRCSSKNPKILTCLHSACQDCFKVLFILFTCWN